MKITILLSLLSILFFSCRNDNDKKDGIIIYPIGIMNTNSTIRINSGDKKIADEIELKLRELESVFSSHINNSETSKINNLKSYESHKPSTEMRKVLSEAAKAYKYSDNVFDISCRPLISLWKKAGKENKLPSEIEIKSTKKYATISNIKINKNSIQKTNEKTTIDLGGIAKGFAIDEAIKILKKNNSTGFIEIGGDIYCLGAPPNREFWNIAIRDPFDDSIIETIQIKDKAICTSGNYERFSIINGQKFSHIINPKTGYPAKGFPSVTVIADTAMQADIWATSLSILGADHIKHLPKDIEAFFILGTKEKRTIKQTKGFKKYLNKKGTE